MQPTRSPSLYLLASLVLALTCIPRARIEVGAPLYLIDVLALLTLASAMATPGFALVGRATRMLLLTGIFLSAVLISQTNVIMDGAMKEGIYILGRYLMAISLIWTTPKIINTREDLLLIIRMAVIGIIVTSVITIGVSFPPTRSFFANRIINNSFLEPAAEQTVERLEKHGEDSGARGQSLVGNATMTGGFLNAAWALTLIGIGAHLFHHRAELLPRMACLLGAAGIIATYTRGALLGLTIGVIGVMLYGQSTLRRNILIGVVAIAGLIGSIGIDSEWFYFDRVQRRTAAVLQGDFSDDNEAGRIAGLIEPIAYLVKTPESIVIGLGNTRGKSENAGKAMFNYHNTPAAAYHFFGLIGAFAHSGLLLTGFLIALAGSRQRDLSPFLGVCYRSMTIGLAAMLPWWAFGHAMASVPRGAMMMFFILGLVAAIEKLACIERYQAQLNLHQGHAA